MTRAVRMYKADTKCTVMKQADTIAEAIKKPKPM